MRYTGVVQPSLMLLILILTSQNDWASNTQAPCSVAGLQCTQWVAISQPQRRLLVYTNYSLGARNTGVTRALVVVHGIRRDADSHFRSILAGAFLDGALTDTLIIAPRFAAVDCGDTLAVGEASWACDPARADHWKSGGTERSSKDLSSFEALDAILRTLASRATFPNLRVIVIAGHSAGGQYVMRYALVSDVPDTLGIPVRFVVANPSSYAYLDAFRPKRDAATQSLSHASGDREQGTSFEAFADATNCTTFNDWPYGLLNRTGYAAHRSSNELAERYARRSVIYLLGEADVLPSGVFDNSCPAAAQGPNRLVRGLGFAQYMRERYSATHSAVVVPFCSHSARCLFTADDSLPIIFPTSATAPRVGATQ